MEKLLGMWDESSEELTINRLSLNQTIRVREAAILAGSNKVFGVVTVGEEVHVLTGPYNNSRPNTRVKFNASGMYRGSSSI